MYPYTTPENLAQAFTSLGTLIAHLLLHPFWIFENFCDSTITFGENLTELFWNLHRTFQKLLVYFKTS